MTESKLVTDNQAREFARLARTSGVSRSVFQDALCDGTVTTFLRSLIPGPLTYPSGVRKHLTPELEVKQLTDPGKVELWLDPRQLRGDPLPTGHDIYEAIKQRGLLAASLSFGHLKWYEAHPAKIPGDFSDQLVYGWTSVVRFARGGLAVPCLDCDARPPYVYWNNLGIRWRHREPAGIGKEF